MVYGTERKRVGHPAPSLKGHRMLPRITQESHSAALRRESQIEPWLANGHRKACAASASEGCRNAEMKTVRQMRLVATKHDEKGLDARELPRLQRWEKCFLLTSPFIEPANCGPRDMWATSRISDSDTAHRRLDSFLAILICPVLAMDARCRTPAIPHNWHDGVESRTDYYRR
jgi:hypothetical protein